MITGCVNPIEVQGLICVGDVTWRAIDSSFWKITGNIPVWTDIRFPATAAKLGANFKPEFDYTNCGVLFPQNDETAKIYEIGQFGHDRTFDSSISPHIHYIQTTPNPPTFILQYRWYENGDVVPNFTTVEASTGIFTFSGSPILQIMEFPDIAGTGHNGVSSVMDIIVYRKTGDGVSGNVLVKEFDIHYMLDSVGSRSEYIK